MLIFASELSHFAINGNKGFDQFIPLIQVQCNPSFRGKPTFLFRVVIVMPKVNFDLIVVLTHPHVNAGVVFFSYSQGPHVASSMLAEKLTHEHQTFPFISTMKRRLDVVVRSCPDLSTLRRRVNVSRCRPIIILFAFLNKSFFSLLPEKFCSVKKLLHICRKIAIIMVNVVQF